MGIKRKQQAQKIFREWKRRDAFHIYGLMTSWLVEPSTGLGMQENEKNNPIWEVNDDFSLRHTEFEVSMEKPGGYFKKLSGYINLKLRG